MSLRALVLVASFLATAPALAAQREADQANLVFTIAGAVSGGANLWSISRQPVFLSSVADTFSLARRRKSGFGVFLAGIYYPGQHVGLAGEAFFLGGGQEDSCTHRFRSGDTTAAAVCTVINGSSRSNTAVILSAGPVFRINARKTITPYVRFNAGLQIGGRSAVEVAGRSGDRFIVVYDDAETRNVSASLAAAAGFTASLGKGYQLRWEVRDNYIGIDRITQATARDGQSPTRELKYHHVWSFVIGVDIVLERRRGRRY